MVGGCAIEVYRPHERFDANLVTSECIRKASEKSAVQLVGLKMLNDIAISAQAGKIDRDSGFVEQILFKRLMPFPLPKNILFRDQPDQYLLLAESLLLPAILLLWRLASDYHTGHEDQKKKACPFSKFHDRPLPCPDQFVFDKIAFLNSGRNTLKRVPLPG